MPVVSFASLLRPLVTEGDELALVVQLDQAPLTDLVIPLVAMGAGSAQAAEAVSDYTLAAPSVTFAAGATGADLMQTVNVTIVADGQIELQEIFTVAFGELPADVTADPAASRVTVAIDSDDLPALSLTAARTTLTVGETTTFTLRSTNGVPLNDVTVPFSGQGPQANNYTLLTETGDRVDISTSSRNTATLVAGRESHTLTFTAVNAGSVVITLNTVAGRYTLATPNTVTITIAAAPAAVPMLVEFVPSFLIVDEDAGSVSGLSVRLDASPMTEMVVPLSTVGGDTVGVATAGTDYTLTTTSVTFASGATGDDLTQAVTLAITEDDLAEGQESFQVVFDTAHATYPAGLTAGRAAFVAITDNEAPGLWVAAFRNTIAETETTTITIHATERLTANLTVPFTLGGTATTADGLHADRPGRQRGDLAADVCLRATIADADAEQYQ